MVARNFPVQDISNPQLLHEPTDENGFITLHELKPVRVQQGLQPYQQRSYYELPNVVNATCSSNLSYNSSQNLGSSLDDSSSLSNSSRKRKPYGGESDTKDEGTEDGKSIKSNDDNKKQNHSEVEKRRRDKMNTYITELSSMVPMCHAMSRKLDKLTVLRLAVQHMKSIRGALPSYTEGNYKPSLLSDQELKHVILQAADGFLFVVGCDRGRILYVSESVSKVLNYSQGDLLGQSLFDIVHPKDVAKVKEQLSSSDINPRERLIDAKTMLPVKTDVPQGASRLCPGARRSFFCRMKCNLSSQVKEEADTTTGYHRRKKYNSDKKFNVIQCTGYLKSWAPAKIGLEEHEETDGDTCNLSCLVAIGRILPHISTVAANCQGMPNIRQIQFTSRHALDGKFLFIDQKSTLVLGYLPQELLGTSMYEYFHHEDIRSLAEYHKVALQSTDSVTTGVYRFRTKSGGFIKIRSEWKSFKNPWTKEIENFNAKNNLILTDFRTVESSASAGQSDGMQENMDFLSEQNDKDMHLLINNHLEVSKIGRQIAEQVMDSQKRGGESSSENSPDPEPSFTLPTITREAHNQREDDEIRNNLPDFSTNQKFDDMRNISFSSIATDPVLGGTTDAGIIEMMVEENVNTQRANPTSSMDGNDEAAMAVIMSLLEADAGLGGPVDFSGLPWPLP